MRIGSGEKFVELLCQLVDGGDFCISVSVHSFGFAVYADGIWISGSEFSTFKSELERLERERSGIATLPDVVGMEFSLQLGAADRAGHLLVSGFVQRHHWILGKELPQRLEFNFELDPEMLMTVLKEFQRFGEDQPE
ncbi:MAG: hypothetical protein PHU85_12015 [Phycisphaerae bacterium]|nr:hypothetical protein [Phycisphaerae bacterium]